MTGAALATSAAHAAAAGAVFAYLHLFKARGCRCVTDRPDFCRLYLAAAALFAWRAVLLALRAARPGALSYSLAGTSDLVGIAVTATLYAAFFAFFAHFAYDVWLARALSGGGTAAPECPCATEARDQRLLGIGALFYGVFVIASAVATLVLLTALGVVLR